MLAASLLALAAASVFAYLDWRRGLAVFVLVGFLQDPLRKLTDGQPPAFVLFAGIVFAAASAGALRTGVRIGPAIIPGFRRELAVPAGLFLAALALQSVNGLARIGSPVAPLLGLISYAAPLLGLAVAVAVVRKAGLRGVSSLLTLYIAMSAAFAVSVAAQAGGLSSTAFGEVGPGIRIYGDAGELAANCGLFRSSEIAAWHLASAAALGVVRLTWRRLDLPRLALALLLALALAGVAMLTGRRKALVLLVTFGALYFGLLSLHVRGAGRAFAALLLFAPVAGVLAAPLASSPTLADGYLGRAGSLTSEGSDRAFNTIWAPLETVYEVYGPLGGGLGLATQGAQYAGLDDDATNGAGEGGIGKIAIELGFPGMAAAAALGLALLRRVARVVASASAADPALGRLVCGLAALLGAHAINFSVAAQAYGDVFVALLLGLWLGVILAAPYFMRRGRRARSNAA